MRQFLGGARRPGGAFDGGPSKGGVRGALIVLVVAAAGVLAFAPTASAEIGTCMQTGFEQVATDAESYPPGGVVHITGSGYGSACDVVIRISRPDGVVETAVVQTDFAGDLAYDYQLLPPPGVVGEYTIEVLGAAEVLLASTTFIDALSATASADVRLSYRNTTNTYTFTIANTSTSNETIGSLQISRPSGEYSISLCPQAPSGWTVAVASATCTYNSGAAANIAAGTTSSSFQVRATVADGDDDLNKNWGVRVHANDTFGGSGAVNATAASAAALESDIHVFEVIDAVVQTTSAMAGAACPPSSRTAPPGSSRVIVVCGKNHRLPSLTPGAGQSPLGGTFVATAGTFASGPVLGNTASSVVLANYTSTAITASAGAGKTVVSTIGSSSNRTSPSTTLSGYVANTAPSAAAQIVTATEDGSKVITLEGSDADGNSLSFSIVSLPADGSLGSLTSPTCSGTVPKTCSATVTYTPDADFNGSDSFQFRTSDGTATSAPATVSITVNPVNDAPAANDGTASVDEDGSETIDLGALVADVETVDANLSYTIVSGPTNGALSGSGASRTYTPNPDYNGGDSFTYKATDRGDPDGCGAPGTACDAPSSSATKTVSIAVRPVNDAPVADDGTASVDEDGSETLDLGALVADVETADANLSYTIVSGPTNGALSGSGASRTYTPNPDYNGGDSFTYKATDRGDPDGCGAPGAACDAPSSSATKTVSITVNPVNDAPVADDDAYATDEDATLSVPAPGVLANDDDVDGDSLTVTTASPVSSPSHGSLTLNADGSFTYEPDADYNGPDAFTYRATDGSVASNVATVSLAVRSVNDAPEATVALSDDSPRTNDTLTATATTADVDGDAVTLTFVWTVDGVVKKTTGGSTALTDSFDLSQAGHGQKGETVTVEVTPNDGSADGAIDDAAATVANSDPVASLSEANDVVVKEGTSHTYAFSASDADDDLLTVTSSDCGPGNEVGTAFDSGSGNGSIECAFPDGDRSGTVAVTVSDGDGGTASDSQGVSVENVAPATPLLASPADGADTADATPTFDWSDASDPGVDVVSYDLEANRGSCDFAGTLEVDESGLADSEFTPTSALADGTYCWRVRAMDEDGAAGNYSGTRTLTIDTAKPNTTITFPTDGGTYNSGGWDGGCGSAAGDICGTAGDPAPSSGLAKVEVRILQASTGMYWDGDGFDSSSEVFVTASGTSDWEYSFAPPADGEYTIHSRATDDAGNVETSFDTATFNEVRFTRDTKAPDVTVEQASGQADPTNAAPIHFTAVFSEPVTGFDGGDVSIGGTAGGTKTVTVADSGDGKTYDVSVSGMSDGSVIASITAGKASDAAGNGNTASTSSDNSVAYDATKPGVSIDQAATQADPSDTLPIHFTAVFTEPVTGFEAGDVAIGGTAPGTPSVTVTGAGDGKTYDVSVDGFTAGGTVTASIDAGKAQDAATNPNTASSSADNTVRYDPDTDADGIVNSVDNCPTTPNPGQEDNDGDAQGDVCDADDDNDTVADGADNCALTANTDQANNDGDAQGDVCDADDDNDTVADGADNCVLTANTDQANNDGDAQGDVCDADDDNDTVGDATDNCPFKPNLDQKDTDRDGKGDVCDAAFNSTPCKLSGTGYISSVRNFSLGAEWFAGSTSGTGSLSYTDRTSGATKNFKSTKITGVVCSGSAGARQATIVGTGTVNTTQVVTFEVNLGDYGTGRTDTFKISWSSPAYSAAGTLTSGDVIVTPK